MPSPIGITFMPSEDNQSMGGQNAAQNGPQGNDLEQAFRILSLRLPSVLGASALGSRRLLGAQGSQSLMSGQDPSAAVIQALLRAMAGGGGPMGGTMQTAMPGGGGSAPTPRISAGLGMGPSLSGDLTGQQTSPMQGPRPDDGQGAAPRMFGK